MPAQRHRPAALFRRLALSVLAAVLVAALAATSPSAADGSEAVAPEARLFAGYDPSPAWPHGRAHPDAPPEIRQFGFMVGEFDCVDRQRRADGTWREFKAIWNASYFLNGHGIQDQYWADTFATSNLRIFDPKDARWKVTYFSMPRYGSGVWEGVKEGDNMVMKKEREVPDKGRVVTSRLTFYEITPESFKWKAEGFGTGEPRASWTSECRRRR